jgi:abortive infection bacteriophage resistance protein
MRMDRHDEADGRFSQYLKIIRAIRNLRRTNSQVFNMRLRTQKHFSNLTSKRPQNTLKTSYFSQ